MGLTKKMRELIILFIENVVYSVVYLTFCRGAEHWNGMDKKQHSIWDKLFNRLYFSIVTFSSVGYGDITPVTRVARALVMIQILFNLNSFAHIVLGT